MSQFDHMGIQLKEAWGAQKKNPLFFSDLAVRLIRGTEMMGPPCVKISAQ